MNAVQKQNNKVCLMGKIVAEPVFSHELYGEEFYDFTLEVPRLSGPGGSYPRHLFGTVNGTR